MNSPINSRTINYWINEEQKNQQCWSSWIHSERKCSCNILRKWFKAYYVLSYNWIQCRILFSLWYNLVSINLEIVLNVYELCHDVYFLIGDPDYKMKCIGYWKENLKSYLITYDELDPFSKYKCWVYQRADLNKVLMSQGNYNHYVEINKVNQYYFSNWTLLRSQPRCEVQ